MRKRPYKVDRTLNTYVVMASASAEALNLAKNTKLGSYYNTMVSMVFCAFCLEAYLNYLGSKKQTGWDIVQRKLNLSGKLDFISTLIGRKMDKGRRPFQTFTEIRRFRNAIVHAKPFSKTERGTAEVAQGEVPPKPRAEWEELVQLDAAQRFFDDTLQMIEALHREAFDEPVDWSLETTFWSMPVEALAEEDHSEKQTRCGNA